MTNKTQSKTLKDFTPQDFKQWKEEGFSKIFFDYLDKKAEDLKALAQVDFISWVPMTPERLKIYENRQAYFRCLAEILSVDFESIDDYYKALEDRENDKI